MVAAPNAYPTTFSEAELETLDLYEHELDDWGKTGLGALALAGFYVEIGVRPEDMSDIAEIAGQDAVRKYCPNDLDTRFGNVEMFERWLAKGRGMFLLRERETGKLAGYGWTGPEENEYLPEAENTFAIRLSEYVAGRRLAKYFTAAIVSGSVAVYGAQKIGLETWESNKNAVKSYERMEAVKVNERAAPVGPDGGPDTRLYMQFMSTF